MRALDKLEQLVVRSWSAVVARAELAKTKQDHFSIDHVHETTEAA